MLVPFVIYAEFESFLGKVVGPENAHSSLHAYKRHIPSGFAYLIVSSDPNRVYEPVVYRGPNVIEEFLKRLKTESDEVTSILSKVIPMALSPEEEKAFSSRRTYSKKVTLTASPTIWKDIFRLA